MLNWGERNPRSDYKTIPWFRMDSDFYRNKKLYGLTVGEKWAWACLLGLAARENKNGIIEAQPDWIADELGISPKEIYRVVDVLESKGLLTVTNVTRTGHVRDTNAPRSLRTNGTGRNETNERILSDSGSDSSLLSARNLFDLWNAHRGSLPGCVVLNETRRRKATARVTEKPDPAYWTTCVQKMAASSFCLEGKWATFDWLIANDNNHVKVSEGKYDNRDQAGAGDGFTVDWSKVDLRDPPV